MTNEITLSMTKTLKLGNGFTIKVGALPLGKIIQLEPRMKELAKLQNSNDMTKQAKFFVEFVYDIVKDFNDGITKEAITNNCTLEACITIMQTAMGAGVE